MSKTTAYLARTTLALLTLSLAACGSDPAPTEPTQPTQPATPSFSLAEQSRAKRFDASFGTVVALQKPIALSLKNVPDAAKLCSSSANVTFSRSRETGTATFGVPEKDVAVWVAPKGDCTDTAAALGRFVVTVEGADLHVLDQTGVDTNVYYSSTPRGFFSFGNNLYYQNDSYGSASYSLNIVGRDLITNKGTSSGTNWRDGQSLVYSLDQSGQLNVLSRYGQLPSLFFSRLNPAVPDQRVGFTLTMKDIGMTLDEKVADLFVYGQANGDVLIASPKNNTLYVYTQTGTRRWAKSFTAGITGLQADKNNRIYVGLNNGTIVAYDPEGVKATKVADSKEGFHVTPDGFLYTSDSPQAINLSTNARTPLDVKGGISKVLRNKVFFGDVSGLTVVEGGKVVSQVLNTKGQVPSGVWRDFGEVSQYFVTADGFSIERVTELPSGEVERQTLVKLTGCTNEINALHVMEEGKLVYSGCVLDVTQTPEGTQSTNRFRVIATLN